MRRRPGALARQRAAIAVLIEADPNRSANSIADEVGCSHHTVLRVRRQQPDSTPEANDQTPANAGHANLKPAGPGNQRGRKHGIYSASSLGPRVEVLAEELATQVVGYSPADGTAVRALAVAVAQVEQLVEYLDDAGMLDHHGKPRAAVALLNASLATVHRWTNDLGLSPASRRRLQLGKAPEVTSGQESEMAQMQREAAELRAAWQAKQDAESDAAADREQPAEDDRDADQESTREAWETEREA